MNILSATIKNFDNSFFKEKLESAYGLIPSIELFFLQKWKKNVWKKSGGLIFRQVL